MLGDYYEEVTLIVFIPLCDLLLLRMGSPSDDRRRSGRTCVGTGGRGGRGAGVSERVWVYGHKTPTVGPVTTPFVFSSSY